MHNTTFLNFSDPSPLGEVFKIYSPSPFKKGTGGGNLIYDYSYGHKIFMLKQNLSNKTYNQIVIVTKEVEIRLPRCDQTKRL